MLILKIKNGAFMNRGGDSLVNRFSPEVLALQHQTPHWTDLLGVFNFTDAPPLVYEYCMCCPDFGKVYINNLLLQMEKYCRFSLRLS